MRSRSSSRSGTSSTRSAARPTSTSVSSSGTGRPRVAVTLGDPRGIGPEVTARALAPGLGADVTLIGADEQIAGIPAERKIGLGSWGRGTGDEGGGELEAGRLAGRSVEEAVRLARTGAVDAIVTGPVHKHALHLAGIRYPGLTEFLSHLAGDVEVAMMLATGPLRVVLVTTHIALKDVPAQVTAERIVRRGRITERALTSWWGIARPRLALCALNPHAGDSGLFGDEDDRILRPAARRVRRGPRTLSRRGHDCGESGGIRQGRERHSGPAVSPRGARPRHGARDCGQGRRGSGLHASGAGAGGGAGDASTSHDGMTARCPNAQRLLLGTCRRGVV